MKLGGLTIQTDTLALHFRSSSADNVAVIDFTERGHAWFMTPLTVILPGSNGERAARAVAAFNAIMSEPDAQPAEAVE